MSAQQIKIGPEFFKRELNVYAHWRMAWFRENVQNSVDAGATSIDITIKSLPHTASGTEQCEITFADNGKGMDRGTLDSVYFVLGETGKSNTNDSIGGFGKARILTCFAQHNYWLGTGNIIVEGCGAEYTVSDTPANPFYQGVKLIVTVASARDIMHTYCEDYLSKCALPCNVTLDGVPYTAKTIARNMKRELSFGKVYVNASQSSALLVRVNGTLMYTKYLAEGPQVLVEIDPAQSRTVLLSNRDSLQWQKQRELEAFMSELTTDVRSALKPKHESKSRIIRGKRGTLTTGQQQVAFTFNPNVFLAGTGKTGSTVTAFDNAHIQPSTNVLAEIDLWDVRINDDTTNDAIRRVIDSYDPRNWRLDAVDGPKMGADKAKLLVMWKIACEHVIAKLAKHVNTSFTWSIGWFFSDMAAAEHVKDNGVHYLTVNPVTPKGNMAYKLTSRESIMRLITCAIHEVTHVIVNPHNEDFASTMTKLVEMVLPDVGHIVQAMKAAK